MHNNLCSLKGEIKHIYETSNGHLLIRISTGRGNVPSVLIDSPELKEQFHYQVGDYIIVFANIVSKIYKRKHNTALVAFSVRELVGNPEDRYNGFEISGKVTKIIKSEEVYTLVIKTDLFNQNESFVPTNFYVKDRYLETIQLGDKVSISGNVQTGKKIINNETLYFQNIVGSSKSLLKIS